MGNKFMKQNITKYGLSFVAAGLLAVMSPGSAYAATINLTPSSGTFPPTRPFTVDVVIDEKTDSFNAAQAQVAISKNLTATDLVLGDCGFSFVKTPTVQNPSFVGVTLGDSKKSCTVYSLTLIPTGNEEGIIGLSEASVKRYGDAKELLTAVAYGKYAVGQASIGTFIANVFPGATDASKQLVPVTNAAGTIKSEKDLTAYTVSVKVTDASDQPLKNAEVQLSPQLQSADTTVKQAKTNDKGVANFTNVSPNVYTVKASEQDNLIAQTIINAKGSDRVLTLGVQDSRPQNPFALIVGIVFMALAVPYFIRNKIWEFFYRREQVPA